ncbi:hypothetical protein [Kitasatospora sp. NPDC097643]|uniref:hypothetical protein n=1 Tax=Kitasatospora sp. NPDC097643 TaxID=3157230 RepID=UPI00332C13FD
MRRLAALALAALLTVAGCTSAPTAPDSGPDATADTATAPAGRPLALVYRGPAACDGCPEAARALLERGGLAVRYIGPHERLHFAAATLAGAAVYVQPGGTNGQEVTTAWDLLRRDPAFRPELVRDYVRGGGRYLGLCMGGYLAGDPGFDLLPGDSGQYVHAEGASVTDERDQLVDVTWRGHRQRMYFQDGPYFDLDPTPNAPETGTETGTGAAPGSVDVLARYLPDNHPAAVVAPYGTGRVAVSGPHPEAPPDWYRDYHLSDESPTGLALGDDLVRTLLAPAPSPPSPPS